MNGKMTLDTKTNIINTAKEAALVFCKEHNYSLDQLEKQTCYYLGEVVGFMQDMSYHGTGLCEDLESQPKPTLYYHVNSGEIETTAYTETYLS